MKTTSLLRVSAVFLLTGVAAVDAGTLLLTDPFPGGIVYRRAIELGFSEGPVDSVSFSRHVGAWSWEDNSLFDAGSGEPPVGWTHTSDWIALTLQSPATVTLRMERDATVMVGATPAGTAFMFPSFTIWSGLEHLATEADTYNNRGDVSWAPNLTYLAHLDNSTQTSAQMSWDLPAGQYTFVLGSNAPATDSTRQGYLATFTAVPEPASALFLLSGIALLGGRRTRRSAAR